jgi:hypothetical protein
MYSHEIQQLIELRNYIVGGDELIEITSPAINPQLDHIKYNPFDSTYEMWSNDNYYFHFKAMDYEEAKQKGLVRHK